MNISHDKAHPEPQDVSEQASHVTTALEEGAPSIPEEGPSNSKTILIMLALCLAVFLAALDITIITTALPTIAAHFKTNGTAYSWIGSGYLLANAATTPSWGKFSDIFGRKPVLLAANVIFLVGSLICALANNIKMLIVGRVFQGIGAGGLMSLVNICIGDLFSERKRGAYYGMVGATWGIASALGPIIGGALAEKVTWRWCFYINLPIDAFAFIVLLVFLDIKTPRTPIMSGLKAIDWPGSVTVVGGTIMFLLGLQFGGVSYPWAATIVICLIIFGIFTGVLFLLTEWKIAKYAIMPLRIFQQRSNVAALAACFCHGFVMLSGFFFLPIYLQGVVGASPIQSGVYLLPLLLSLAVTSVITGIYIRKTGRYLEPMRIGFLLMTLGFGLFINLPAHTDWAKIITFQIIAGLGTGPNFMAPLIALQTVVAAGDNATATATFMFVRQMAIGISVVIGSVVFQNQMQKHYGTLLHSGVSPQFASALTGGSATSLTTLVRDLPPLQRAAAKDAYTASIQKMWILYACVGMVGFLASLAVRKQELKQQHEVIQTGLEAQEKNRIKAEADTREQQQGVDGTGTGQELDLLQ